MNFKTALLDVRQMAEADRLSVEAGISVSELMDNAGAVVTSAIRQRWTARPVAVLCGPGNNGGDGFVTARLLDEAGWRVRVALLGSRENLKGAALHHANQWRGALEQLTPAILDESELVVDAIFGAGLSRPLRGAAADTLTAAASRKIPIVAIDVPSGLMGDTGETLGAVSAVLTVTFFRKKPGHVLLPGRMLCGEVIVEDIGTPTGTLAQLAINTFENDPGLWVTALPRPHENSDKYTRGHALISDGYPLTGPARLAAIAAARTGAGLTTIAVPEIAMSSYASPLTSITVQPIKMQKDFQQLLDNGHFSGLLIGLGAVACDETRIRALAMLRTGCPTILTAEAITVFQDNRQSLFRAIIGPCIINLNEVEFSRLFDPSGDKLTRVRTAARRSGAVIVLKGSDTVIASPDGTAIINANAPPTLATNGSGDVLNGVLLGLLTQNMNPFPAAAAAVWLHEAAATELGLGLIAEDMADLIPVILRRQYDQDANPG